MARCYKLEVKDTGWFSYEYYCRLNGMKLGDERNKDQVEKLCDCSNFEYRPIYQSSIK